MQAPGVKNSIRTYLTPFLLGVIAREVVIFIKEQGFSNDYPLSRALFIIMACLSLLFWMWGEEREQVLRREIRHAEDRLNDTIRARVIPTAN
jgi:hypothetical protein